MMRKAIIFSCTVGSVAIILGKFGFYESILMLFLAGIIPGTHYTISGSNMFYSIVITMAAFIVWLGRGLIIDVVNTWFGKTEATKPRQKHLPKRRFSQI